MADYTSVDMAAKLQGKSGKVVAGIRPTHIELAPADAANAIRAPVDVSEMMGSEIHLHVSAQGKDVVLVLPTEWHGGIPYGTEITFTAQGGLVHLFDADTEENLLK